MAYELVSLDNRSVSLSITPGTDISLGRQAQLGVTNKAVSREHCALHCLKGTEGQDPCVIVTARKRCSVSGPSREQCALLPGKSLQLSLKDVVYLSSEGGAPGDGFRLQQSAGHRKLVKTPSQAGSQKRWRSSPCVKGEAPADAARSKCMRADAAPSLAGDKEAAPPEKQAAPAGVFAGLRFLFWVVAFTGPLKNGAQKAGATVADELDPSVTHVIAQKGTSAKQASAKLQTAGTHSPVLRVEGEELVELPTGVHFVTKEWVGDCLGQGKLLPEGRYLIDLAQMALLAKLQGPSSPGSFEEGSGMDAEAVAVVTSGSPFKSPDGQPSVMKNDKGVTVQAITMQTWLKRIQQALSRAGDGTELAMPPKMAALWRMHTPLEHHPPLGMEGEWKLWQETGLGFPVSQQMQESSQGDHIMPLHGPESTAANPGSPLAHEKPRSAQHAQTPEQPGSEAAAPDSIKHHPWGEPYDVQAAQETKKMLYDHYHKQDLGRYARLESLNRSSAPGASPQKSPQAHSKAERPHASAGSEDEDEARGNPECDHAACSAKSFCIVRHLRDIKNNYVRDRERYSKLAMDVIMGRVEALTEPLRSAEDCDCVRGEGVGKDNVDKLKEIVRTGAYRRNEQLAQDAHHQAIKLFLTVWGTGEKGAEMWWSQGCRTLEDLRGRDDLSAQQAAGLKYYEDMQRRIPREETARIEAVVREAVVDLLHCREAHDASTLFCHAVGSYIRGKPDTGDVDMLILPPESCVEVDSRLALYELLQILRRRGLMLEDMMAREAPSEKGYGSATFLGLCRHATSPCVRRIDLKWYPRRYMPFALTHFIGSGLFNRALRYWARTATEAARAVSEHADGFKLSEYGLVPIRKVKPGMKGAQSQHKSEGGPAGTPRESPAGHSQALLGQDSLAPAREKLGHSVEPEPESSWPRSSFVLECKGFSLGIPGQPHGLDILASVQEELGPCVECKLESDIFRALGLAYVPFHLRWWYGYE